MKPIKESKFAVAGANALFGLLLLALSVLADDRPPGDQPAKAPQPAPNVPADAVPDRLVAPHRHLDSRGFSGGSL